MTDDKTPPEDLFHNLEIDNSRYEIMREGWKNAADRLREMNSCPAALQDARHLHVDIWVFDSQYIELIENSMPPLEVMGLFTEVPQLFTEVLSSMTSLERLDFGVSGLSSVAFGKAFAEANIILPSVTHVQPGAYSDWLLPRCPDLEVVVVGDHWSWDRHRLSPRSRKDKHEALMDAMRGLPIMRLKLTPGWQGWSLKMFENVLDATPHLTTLEMDGLLNRLNQMKLSEGEALKQYLSILSQFSHLVELQLPNASELDLGFDGGAACGNVYIGAAERTGAL